jgi:putative membrane protein
MLPAAWKKNDRKARTLILTFSLIVFATIVLLGRYKLNWQPGFDVHVFARINAIINSIVAVLLVLGLIAVKLKEYMIHKWIMITSIVLSSLFLISYIFHHLLAPETKFGGTGTIRYVYFFILGTHILLAGIILPLILFTAYRALVGEYAKHKKLVRITWPVWFYVAVTGVIVYWMISPYYK